MKTRQNVLLSRTKDKPNKEQAFNAMLLRNKALIWHICSDYNLGKVWKVEDCMQEVIVSLWRYFDTFEGRSSEQTWIYRVATNTMLMLRRKDIKNPTTEQIDVHSEINDMSYEAHDDNSQLLRQLINELPEENGMIIRAHLDGFSYKEIAEMTNLTEGTIAMRITRIKQQLKEMFEKESKEDI
jgi:RNA polymerase sigma-70 factor (ECF subfamily)